MVHALRVILAAGLIIFAVVSLSRPEPPRAYLIPLGVAASSVG